MDPVGVLVNQLSLRQTGFVAFAYFHGVNIPTVADFKLLTQNGSWEETRIINSPKPERARSGMPLNK